MSKRKSIYLEEGGEELDQVIYQRTNPIEAEQLSPLNTLIKVTECNNTASKEGDNTAIKCDITCKEGVLTEDENGLSIGCSIRPANTNIYGTVGPFVRIKETQDLCFLTARNIFGPFQRPQTFQGTKVYLSGSDVGKIAELICGETISDAMSENMDIALVKISEQYKSAEPKFIDAEKRQMLQLGFESNYLSLFGNTNSVMEARGLTLQDMKNYKLIKVGSGSGLTQGILDCSGEERVVKSESFFLTRQSPDGTCTRFMNYENQLLVHSVGDDEFANDKDVGAGVYLVDENEAFHCIGVLLCKKDDGFFLVTPIQEILRCLGEKIGKTLEIVTFDSLLPKGDNEMFDQKEKEVFERALRMGKEKDKHIRINIIGFYAQGKTSLTKRLLHESLQNIESTDGIDVHIKKCKISADGWEILKSQHEMQEFSRRLVLVSRDLENSDSQSIEEQLDLTSPLKNDHTNLAKEIEENNEDKNGFGTSVSIDTPENKMSNSEKFFTIVDNLIESQSNSDVSAQKKILLRHFSEEMHKIKPSAENNLIATIWDFGGQYIYYTTHQIFHSRDAIYLLVFNLNKDLDNIIEDYDFPGRQEKMKNSLMFWVNSINTYVGTNECSEPIVILVGTHKDTFQGNLEAKFTEVKDLFAGTEVRKHLYEKAFAVENSNQDDSAIEELRKTMYDIGKQNAKAKSLPASWIHLEMSLLQENEKNIVSFQQVLDLNTKIDLPLSNKEELKVFLKYNHDKGTLVYFDETELRDFVILNPQFLINAFRCIITSKVICDGCPKLHDLWKRMVNMAILDKELLKEVWSKNPDFAAFSTIILKFLIRHRILAEILKMDVNGPENTFKRTQNYIIPSFLKVSCTDDATETFIHGKTCSSVILGLSLKNNLMINTIYERVLAAVLGNFPPIEFRDQVLVFQNLSYLLINRRHAGRIQKVEKEGIELMVIKLIESDENLNKVCDDLRRKVETVIRQEFWKLQNSDRHDPFKHYIKCNDISHQWRGSKKSYWLKDITDDQTVSCPDFDNHAVNIPVAVDEWFQQEMTSNVRNEEQSERLVTYHDLTQISQAVGSNWELLAYELDVSPDTVQRIRMEYQSSGVETVIFHALKEWKDRDVKKAFLSHLLETMRKTEAVKVNWEKIKTITEESL